MGLYDNDFRLIVNICFYDNFSTLHFCFNWTLAIQTQASSLGILITFVNNFCFKLFVMFVYFINESSVVNLIYLKQLVLL